MSVIERTWYRICGPGRSAYISRKAALAARRKRANRDPWWKGQEVYGYMTKAQAQRGTVMDRIGPRNRTTNRSGRVE